MIIDDKYFQNAMFLLAANYDNKGLNKAEIDKIREDTQVMLQQGVALLSKERVVFDKKFNPKKIPTWNDFND